MTTSNDNPGPSAWERIEGAIEKTRENVPSLTTGLLIATLLIGVAVGAWGSKPFHRRAINQEWRERISGSSAAVRGIIAAGDAEAEETDNAIIAALGATDAKLSAAENRLKIATRLKVAPRAAGSPGNGDECRIPANGLR